MEKYTSRPYLERYINPFCSHIAHSNVVFQLRHFPALQDVSLSSHCPFDTLQKSDGHVSQQMDNLSRLADGLVSKCGATVDDWIISLDNAATVIDSGIQMGPCTIAVVKLTEYILSMGVSALFEVFESLSQREKNAVL